ncbi:pyridoxamine 5'-phosphate oxidase [Pseudoduganella namucuonensis]|uniref:Pyridoxine/pyridoxamine 5'-phosphate oxidase n=1 Tax=Pseudoduganella namucuonensis TaxID=1035707 RepID=A0A1I7KKX4_9BURK|nr:pyridoxamine 5'-phosphate oxidase [Pseudoduganella namucuonensis]SFU98078.1 Pyridoxamine 5'-phosphate oxidase [Pseudoduganella namucuonensis]
MSTSLIDTAPDFGQPIAVLKHCHDRIRKQLATLGKLPAHLAAHGADDEAAQAARAVLKYFDNAAHLHHEDEERNLLPMLEATARDADAALLRELAPRIVAQHAQMDADWLIIKSQLAKIATQTDAALSDVDVQKFVNAYTGHMEQEEAHIAPMAKRLFSPAQMHELGEAMRQRRGVAQTAAPAAAPAPRPEAAAPVAGGVDIADLRLDYGRASLDEGDTLDHPVAQFAKWFDEAMKAEVFEANAMAVSTVGLDGKPTSRIVLIKQYDARGFTWYTNYESQKGRQLEENPNAALLFFWRELERQVRIEGRVEKTSAEDSDKYFYSRPVKSQLAAVASRQSEWIASRTEMETNFAAVEAASGGQPKRPAHWGGYRLVPERVEFWQGRRSRFHDRIVFTLQADGGWKKERLQP